jgi:hypothetical protein
MSESRTQRRSDEADSEAAAELCPLAHKEEEEDDTHSGH